MFDFQQKRKFRAVFESRITWTILLVLTGLMTMSAYSRYQIARDTADKRAEAEAEKARLETRKTDLEEEVKYLSNDRGIEAEMRRQFDVAKDGEQIIVIVEDEAAEASLTEPIATSTAEEVRPWYRFW